MRTKITLACTECKQRNYDTTKDKKAHPVSHTHYTKKRSKIVERSECYGREDRKDSQD